MEPSTGHPWLHGCAMAADVVEVVEVADARDAQLEGGRRYPGPWAKR